MAANKKKKKTTHPLFGLLFLIFICVVLFAFNIRIWRERTKNTEHLRAVEEELYALNQEVDGLQSQIFNEDSDNLIERIAREQLLLRKDGENVVVISRMEEPESEEEEEIKEDGFFHRLMEIIR